MTAQTFASIYIGSYEVSLKVFELSAKKKLHEIDYIRSRLDLGRDVYQRGALGYEMVDGLCDTLSRFSTIMDTYRVDAYEVYAAAVLRDAQNELFVIDQVLIRTGFKIKVISNSEYRFMTYQSVAGRPQFETMIETSAAVVDVGGSGIQITIFREGSLITTQHLDIGTVRLRELLYANGQSLRMYEMQIQEYIDKKLEVFSSLYAEESVDHVIVMSDYCENLMRSMDKKEDGNVVKSEKFIKYTEKLLKKTVEEISQELNLSSDSDPLIVPALLLFKSLVQVMRSEKVWVPGVSISDGIAYDYARKNRLVKETHDFDADIISAAQNLSRRFHCFSPHIEALSKLSAKIFDTMKKSHGLNKRHRLLLEVATILHDCGKYVSMANSARCTYEVILSSEIMGLSHLEREIVAMTVLYHNLPLDSYEDVSDRIDQDSYLVVAKLSAILCVANALDQSHRQKFHDLRISLKGKELVITVESLEDISLEQALFVSKTAYFEHVFSLKPVLKEKRVYSYQ